MFEYKKGMICIVEVGIGQKDPDAEKTAVLEQGTPVKIVEIVEPECSMMVNGECQAPCKGSCCPRSIVVEDCNGKQWTVKPDIEDWDFPLIALDEGDPKMLLAKKDWKRFKLAEWTDEGIGSKYKGPVYITFGAMLMSTANELSGAWGLVFSAAFGLMALYGAVIFLVGNQYAQKPLPYGQILFYQNYEKNKAALEALMR